MPLHVSSTCAHRQEGIIITLIWGIRRVVANKLKKIEIRKAGVPAGIWKKACSNTSLDSSGICSIFNPSKTKGKLFYLATQSVLGIKQFYNLL